MTERKAAAKDKKAAAKRPRTAAKTAAKKPAAEATPAAAVTRPPEWSFSASRQFVSWLAEHNVSVLATTYQAGKFLLIGRTPDERLSIMQRNFPRSMGLWTDGQTMLLSTLWQMVRFENSVPPGQEHNGFDRMFVPRVTYVTGDLDAHDIAVARGGRIVFVNTLFGCLATVNVRHSFEPLWRPSFLSKLAAEDRCHLNGLAMQDGQPRYVTALSESDAVDSWRDHRATGGVLIDVPSNRVIARGLSMPHSPRLHRGRLWLLNSGTGEFGHVDPRSGRFEAVTFCPGYARGLSFHGDFALVGLSKPRDSAFTGLALETALQARKTQPRCGVVVIDLRSGDIVHSLMFEGSVSELYDVVALPGVRRPAALGFETDEVRRAISIAPARTSLLQAAATGDGTPESG